MAFLKARPRWAPPPAMMTGLESVLFGLGVLEDFCECDQNASGGVLAGSGDEGTRLCGGGARRCVVGEVQVQQSVRRSRADVLLGPDLRRLQPSQSRELARQ